MKTALISALVLVPIILELGDAVHVWSLDPRFSSQSCILHVDGRDYLSPTHCGTGGRDLCWSVKHLKAIGDWPPGRRVPILSFSGISTVYVRSGPGGVVPTWVLVPRGRCYVPYALSGGP